MGAGASAMTVMNKEAFQQIAPDHYTLSLFNTMKDSSGGIPAARLVQFTAAATDCFLTHDWGKDELGRDNHSRVGKLNAVLKAKGFRTWFDEEMMRGDIQLQMADGIDHASCVVVFITERYMEKVAGKGEKGNLDNCLFEFSHLSTSKDRNKIFPVVMEPRCRDTGGWIGKVKFVLGNQLYTDYCSDDNVEAVADDLVNKMRQVLTEGRTVNEHLNSMPAVTTFINTFQSVAVAPAKDLLSAVPVSSGYKFKSNEELSEAVYMWRTNRKEAIEKYGRVSTWNTSKITSMNYLFRGLEDFNEDISSWDVSNVTEMACMFNYARSFNQPIGTWNVRNVTDMHHMFSKATNFNQPLNSWSVGNVTVMDSMFSYAKNFNQPLDHWDVSQVTLMSDIFAGAEKFNQAIGVWNVRCVTSMKSAFEDAKSFNQSVASWSVVRVKNMCRMFWGAVAFNQPLDNWNVSSVTDMSSMFRDAKAFNQPIGTWNVSNVEHMYSMFQGAQNFNQPLDKWNVSKVINMLNMFYQAESFNQPIGTWDVSKVTCMKGMFGGAKNFNQPIGTWNIGNVSNRTGMFQGSGYTHEKPKKPHDCTCF